ncbi:RNA pseudouridine synthase [Shewanella sp. WXL01]|uniref:RluA family pseudouridine synthase n=1 Tax=Shewanella sp. WXL01 TaxID=2709721 RepID=UPI0014383200|nr:RluA family pseudouridine synthase [Shewanella sp. WXL01]NKF49922.1 RNA pseudouridine synthase [Shewanella sp. WXL01]
MSVKTSGSIDSAQADINANAYDADCFIEFNDDISQIALPEKFTFPFYYQPHALSELAAKQLQQDYLEPNPWQHNFGLNDSDEQQSAVGKMFGVLVVKNQQGKLGFIAAFSGKLADQNLLSPFVPPVFDMLTQDSFFAKQSQEINQINAQIESLSQSEQLAQFQVNKQSLTEQRDQAIQAQQQLMVTGRKQRKAQRKQAQAQLEQLVITEQVFNNLSIELSRQSVTQKNQLAEIKAHWLERITEVERALDKLTDELQGLKAARKQQSNQLQQQLFAEYQFNNGLGEIKDLNAIFADTPNHLPPAAAGECAAPKLLQYAFTHKFEPIAMAEFWWGKAPKSEVKQHKNYYPACHSKCRPILGHMLQGLNVEPDPLLINTAADKQIEIIYEDAHIVVINKPAEMLSVAGKHISDSVQTRMKQRYPKASGPLIVHRLDMSTSGLMVIALSSEANKALVQQFIERTVCKRYVALIDDVPAQQSGDISLPLRVDLDDRPKQLVCYEHGKHAETHWQLERVIDGKALLALYPKTGRTHQLRMHCAHHLGLGMAIVGDDLYGKHDKRLHLHAQQLSFNHPDTGALMQFEVKAEFE